MASLSMSVYQMSYNVKQWSTECIYRPTKAVQNANRIVAGSLRPTFLGCRLPMDQTSYLKSRVTVAARCEVADPLNNYIDSFGNDCIAERKAHLELMASETYIKAVHSLSCLSIELEELVVQERYEEAAEIRDAMNMLQFRKRLLEMSSKPRVQYRVGDIVIHKTLGYRGVIYGHDTECSAPLDWQKKVDTSSLQHGSKQPFYHVLVDQRDNQTCSSTYVAQEDLTLKRFSQPVEHPWISRFFIGFQGGTYFPGSKLRGLYPHDW